MIDSFTITIVFIILATLVAALIRGRNKDKCLKDFASNVITLEQTSGKILKGTLRLENTGLELIYPSKTKNKNGNEEASYILYKHEYPNIQAIILYHSALTELGKKKRQKELKKIYHPSLLRRLKRKIKNIFKTIKDSIMEVFNLLIMQAKKTPSAGSLLGSQDKYVSQMKQDLFNSVSTSFEPLLEKHIGHKVVLEMIKEDKILKYVGILKDYTAEFIEMMDVDYPLEQEQPFQQSDIIVPRKYCMVRYLGE